jgi:cystathionine beta-lyase/cystathionine gamma-synthase
MRIGTALIHAGAPRPQLLGAVTHPIFQSSTFVSGGDADYHDVRYARCSNTPSHEVLHARLAALEEGEAALTAASGMAAISATLLSLLRSGDHIVLHRTLYGGTHDFVTKDLSRLGIEHTFVDADTPASWAAALRPTTRAFYVEAMTNPLLEVVDLEAVPRFCREHRLVSLIDSTCASPVNYRPIAQHGFDLVLHSATKYLNGHSDIVAGAVIGSRARVKDVKRTLDHLGGSLDPHACFLLERGMKTLALRVGYQNESSTRIARFLEEHPAVARVRYPGLESHPRRARAKAWFVGSGGLLSFELKGGLAAAQELVRRSELLANAPSLGGVETLVTRPVQTSHSGLSKEDRASRGITDGLLRLSVGVESTEDLIEDLERALS